MKLFHQPSRLNILEQETVRKTLIVDREGTACTYLILTPHTEWIVNTEIQQVDKAILEGEAIGEAFRKKGFQVRKNILDVYTVSLSPWLKKAFATTEAFAKTRNVEYVVKKKNEVYNYALVTEIHSPEFRPAVVSDADTEQINFSFYTLKAAGFPKEEIWKLIEPARNNVLM